MGQYRARQFRGDNMKYISGLIFVIGLMACSHTFANTDGVSFKTDWDDYEASSLKECTNAAENGIKLDSGREDSAHYHRYLHQDKIYFLIWFSLDDAAVPEETIVRCIYMKRQ